MSNVTPMSPQLLKGILTAGWGRSILQVEMEIAKRKEKEKQRRKKISYNYVLHISGFRVYK